MKGFRVREWFSSERLARRQAWLESRRESLQKKGARGAFRTVFSWIWKIIKYLVLAILLIWVMAEAIEDNAVAIALALPPLVLIGLRRFWQPAIWLAAGILALYGLIGIGAFVSTCLGGDAHVGALYGTAVLVGFFGAMLIDSNASLTLAACALVALAATIVVALLGEVLNVVWDFPTALVMHLCWIALGVAAVVLSFLFARLQAAMLILVTVSAAGFQRFVWAYDGIRRQDVDIFGLIVIPDQAFYGLLFLVAAVTLLLTPARFPKKRESSEEEEAAEGDWDGDLEGTVVPEEDAGTDEMPSHEEAKSASADYILNRLYQADKKERIFTRDGSAFLVKALRRLGITQGDLDGAGVDIGEYAEYAVSRAIGEIRGVHVASKTVIIRKDGTVHPHKLSEIGFRPDFLTDHEITGEELLG